MKYTDLHLSLNSEQGKGGEGGGGVERGWEGVNKR